MNFLLFLMFFVFFAIPSEYVCSLTKVDCSLKLPEDLQVQDLVDKWSLYAKGPLKNQSIDSEKVEYAYDGCFDTSACVQKISKYYQVAFCHKTQTCLPFSSEFEHKPRCIGVSKNFLFRLSEKSVFYFIEIPFDNCIGAYYARDRSEIEVCFDESVNEILQRFATLCNAPVYCYPGDCGNFYLAFNDLAIDGSFKKKDLEVYLFTIEKSIPKVPPIISTVPKIAVEPASKPEQPKIGLRAFFKRKVFLICGVVGITGLLIALVSLYINKR